MFIINEKKIVAIRDEKYFLTKTILTSVKSLVLFLFGQTPSPNYAYITFIARLKVIMNQELGFTNLMIYE